MGLKYDFDIFTIMPDETRDDTEAADMLVQNGIHSASQGNTLALFRDIKTADALRSASPAIRQLFLESGFGLSIYHSGAAEDYYPARDEAARLRILKRFAENMKNTPLKGEYCGDFDMSAFMKHILAAKPINHPERSTKKRGKSAPENVQLPERRSVLARVGFAIGVAVVALTIIKWLAAVPPG